MAYLSVKSSGGGSSDVVDDTSPQLGGDLDTNAHFIDMDDGTGLRDGNDNEYLLFQQTANAVNHIEITNMSSGFPPKIQSAGSDGNIGLQISAKGSMDVTILSDLDCQGGVSVFGETQMRKAKVISLAESTPGAGNTLTNFSHGGAYLHITGGNVILPNITSVGEQYVILNGSGGQISISIDSGDTIAGSTTVDDGKALTCVAVTSSRWFAVG